MENNGTSIKDNLCLILNLQKNSCCPDECIGCTKPFLGPTPSIICYNTRPITLYSCCSGDIWTMPYTLNGISGTSSTFRIENIEGNCATFRILIPGEEENTYTLSQSYFTIDLSCVLAMQCLNDTYAI